MIKSFQFNIHMQFWKKYVWNFLGSMLMAQAIMLYNATSLEITNLLGSLTKNLQHRKMWVHTNGYRVYIYLKISFVVVTCHFKIKLALAITKSILPGTWNVL